MKHLKILSLFILSLLFFITSCNTDDTSIPEGKGKLNVYITDAPFPIDLISSTSININKIEIRYKAELDAESDQDSFIVISDEEMEIDLLDLTNGITELMASIDLEPGYYDMIRLHVGDAVVVMNDESVFDLKIPSGYSSGLKIKIKPAIYLTEGQTSDVLLDFDVSKSFVAKGNIKNLKGFNFKPVVRAVYIGAAGRIEGDVTNENEEPLENAYVKILLPDDYEWNEDSADSIEDNCIASFSDINGEFKIIGLPIGDYTVVCELEGYTNDTIENVTVKAGESTKINFQMIEEPLVELPAN